jgi:hypothetical protein
MIVRKNMSNSDKDNYNNNIVLQDNDESIANIVLIFLCFLIVVLSATLYEVNDHTNRYNACAQYHSPEECAERN